MSRLVRLLLVALVASLGIVTPVAIATAAGTPQITTSSLPSVVQGKTYPATQLKVTGGTGPYTWSVAPGSAETLPYGLKLSVGGRISGATANALYSPHDITFQVKDRNGLVAVRELQIVVNPFVITNASLPKAKKGFPYYVALKTNGACLFGGKMMWEDFDHSLPTGLKLSYSGVISGVPKVVGTVNFRARAYCSLFNNGDTVKVLPLTVS